MLTTRLPPKDRRGGTGVGTASSAGRFHPSGWTDPAARPGRARGDPGSSVFFSAGRTTWWSPPGTQQAAPAGRRDSRDHPAPGRRLLDHALPLAGQKLRRPACQYVAVQPQLTWRLVGHLVDRRNTLLTTDAAAKRLASVRPAVTESPSRFREAADEIARLIMYHLDRAGPTTQPTHNDIRRASACGHWAGGNPLDRSSPDGPWTRSPR